MSQMGPAEKDRQRRRTDGRPPNSGNVDGQASAAGQCHRPTFGFGSQLGQRPPVFGQLGEVFPEHQKFADHQMESLARAGRARDWLGARGLQPLGACTRVNDLDHEIGSGETGNITLTLSRMGQAGKALSIGLMTAGTASHLPAAFPLPISQATQG